MTKQEYKILSEALKIMEEKIIRSIEKLGSDFEKLLKNNQQPQ